MKGILCSAKLQKKSWSSDTQFPIIHIAYTLSNQSNHHMMNRPYHIARLPPGLGGVVAGALLYVLHWTQLRPAATVRNFQLFSLFPREFQWEIFPRHYTTTMYYYTCNSYLETVKMATLPAGPSQEYTALPPL